MAADSEVRTTLKALTLRSALQVAADSEVRTTLKALTLRSALQVAAELARLDISPEPHAHLHTTRAPRSLSSDSHPAAVSPDAAEAPREEAGGAAIPIMPAMRGGGRTWQDRVAAAEVLIFFFSDVC